MKKSFLPEISLSLLVSMMASAETAPRPSFQGLRANESYDSLRDVDPLQDWQRWKMIGLSPDRSTYLSVGANLRLRMESTSNTSFQDNPTENVLLHRWMAHASLNHEQFLTVFGQLKGSYIEGSRNGFNPNDEDPFDLHQAFVELRAGNGSFQMRAGRQELAYGSARLVGIRDGPNVRLSFDALRLRSQIHGWEVDAFLAQPVSVSDGEFDDRGIDGESLWGLHARHSNASKTQTLEAYYLGFRDADATYRKQTAEETRHTLGLRWAGREAGWDWDVEPMLQLGSFGGEDIFAWSVGSNSGYTFSDVPLKPRLGLKANLISGDNGSGSVGTFNAMYPRGAYFGESGIIGPANLINFEPSLTLHPAENLRIIGAVNAFYRESTDDGIYNPGRRLIRDSGTSDSRYVGMQYSLETIWRPNEYLTLTAYLSAFTAGSFLKDTGPSETVGFAMVSVECSF